MNGNKISSARGKAGEDAVCERLKKEGCKIIKRNYHVQGGEIDIISEKGDCIAFTEVKTRKFGAAVQGYEAMTKSKMKRIVAASERFIADNPRYEAFFRRFDTAFVTVTTDEFPQILDIEYYKGDFTLADIE